MSGVRDIRRGEAIEAESMRIIEAEVPEPRPYHGAEWLVVRRMIHTTADFELLNLVRFHPLAVQAGLDALSRGCTLFTDTEMARAGIPDRRMNALGCTVRCLMRDAEVLARSQAQAHARGAMIPVRQSVQDLYRKHGLCACGACGSGRRTLVMVACRSASSTQRSPKTCC